MGNPVLQPRRTQLVALNRASHDDHLHFGLLVANEILTFLENATELGEAAFSLERAFNRAVPDPLPGQPGQAAQASAAAPGICAQEAEPEAGADYLYTAWLGNPSSR